MKNNRVIVAVAGAGKTEEIAKCISDEPNKSRVLLLTYTTRNQWEDATRIVKKLLHKPFPVIKGWQSFLLNDIIRPYLPAVDEFSDIELRSLDIQDPGSLKGMTTKNRLFNKYGDARACQIALLATKVNENLKDEPLRRLERLYDAIYIDEAQDLIGNDLDIVKKLFRSNLQITIACDPRQAAINTTNRDTKHKEYRYANMVNFYQELKQKKLCSIEYKTETFRCVPEIAQLSDTVFNDSYDFPTTQSNVKSEDRHTGIFLLDKENVGNYVKEYGATVLRHSKKEEVLAPDETEIANFGECKGMSRNHIVIMATEPIEKFLSTNSTEFKDDARCKFYVAITRARFSVAIAVKNPHTLIAKIKNNSNLEDINFQIWSP